MGIVRGHWKTERQGERRRRVALRRAGNVLGATGSSGKRGTEATGQESGEGQVSPPGDSGLTTNPWAGSLGSRNAGGCEQH